MTKLRALVNMSHGKMLLIGDTFEENSKKNVDFFVKKKFAEVVEIETEEVPEDEKTEEEPIEDVEDFEDDFDDTAEPFDEEEIDKARTHDQLDEIQKNLGFDLPGKDKLNLDQRKAKIKAELSGDAK